MSEVSQLTSSLKAAQISNDQNQSVIHLSPPPPPQSSNSFSLLTALRDLRKGESKQEEDRWARSDNLQSESPVRSSERGKLSFEIPPRSGELGHKQRTRISKRSSRETPTWTLREELSQQQSSARTPRSQGQRRKQGIRIQRWRTPLLRRTQTIERTAQEHALITSCKDQRRGSSESSSWGRFRVVSSL